MRIPEPSRRTPSCRRQISPNQALLAAVLAALGGVAPAQQQFTGLGTRATSGWPVISGHATSAALGDVDGDGDLDVVVGRVLPQQNQLCLNNGHGRFTDATATNLPVANDDTWFVAFGDVDGDGDLDLVSANLGQNCLHLNDGTGVFTDATTTNLPADNDYTTAVALGDVDGDGDIDIVCANSQSQNRLHLNNGNGRFTDATASRLPVDNDSTQAAALGDVDGDGDLDIVFGNEFGQQNRVCLNNGSGTFTDATATRMPVDSDTTVSIALGDVDGDGDLDMVTGNWLQEQNRLCLNNGSGTFTDATATRMPNVADSTGGVVFGDVDGDGDLDLVFGNTGYCPYYSCYGAQNRLCLNNGNGTFTDATSTHMPVDPDVTENLAIGDLDGDGDTDLVVANWDQSRRYVNLQHQLDAPLPFAAGQTYRLEAYLRYGPASTGDFAFPAMSLAPAAIPLPPYGTFGIDPGFMVPLPMITIPQPAGVGSVTLAVPNLPGLAGLEVYSQALLVPVAGQATLSNVVADVLTIEPVNLVVNGGFEHPALGYAGAWNVYQAIPGWTTSSGCGIEVQNRNNTSWPLGGDQLAETDSYCPTAFYQDVATVPGHSYVLSLGYSPRPGVVDNAVNVQWNAAALFALQQDGSALSASAWTVHRALVPALASTTRLEIADASVSDSYGGLVDEVSVHEANFVNTSWLVGEVVLVPQEVQTLRGHLLQAEAAQASNNQAAKAAALQAFVSRVQALPASTVNPGDGAMLVAIAGVL